MWVFRAIGNFVTEYSAIMEHARTGHPVRPFGSRHQPGAKRRPDMSQPLRNVDEEE